MTKKNRVDFDNYTDQYEEFLQKQLVFFNKSRAYFSEYKIALVSKHRPTSAARILDFGCGIGLNLPFLLHYFPSAQIAATDLSEKSLGIVQGKYPEIKILQDYDLNDKKFNIILVSGVFHHIPTNEREGVMKKLAGLLSLDGRLFIFEHNPLNFITRRMVANCPFDQDAELITLRDMKRLIAGTTQLEIPASGYCLFFPEQMSSLRPLEKYLHWLPGGGQYFVIGAK
jgi:2-polyprenyl-3-methyl-5-hydroxy-6-metoxy-1,4-benzoquinol methylase